MSLFKNCLTYCLLSKWERKRENCSRTCSRCRMFEQTTSVTSKRRYFYWVIFVKWSAFSFHCCLIPNRNRK